MAASCYSFRAPRPTAFAGFIFVLVMVLAVSKVDAVAMPLPVGGERYEGETYGSGLELGFTAANGQKTILFVDCEFAGLVQLGVTPATVNGAVIEFRSCTFGAGFSFSGSFASYSALRFVTCTFNSAATSIHGNVVVFTHSQFLVHDCVMTLAAGKRFQLSSLVFTDSSFMIQHTQASSNGGDPTFGVYSSTFTRSSFVVRYSNIVQRASDVDCFYLGEGGRTVVFSSSTAAIVHNRDITSTGNEAMEIDAAFATLSTLTIYNNTIKGGDDAVAFRSGSSFSNSNLIIGNNKLDREGSNNYVEMPSSLSFSGGTAYAYKNTDLSGNTLSWSYFRLSTPTCNRYNSNPPNGGSCSKDANCNASGTSAVTWNSGTKTCRCDCQSSSHTLDAYCFVNPVRLYDTDAVSESTRTVSDSPSADPTKTLPNTATRSVPLTATGSHSSSLEPTQSESASHSRSSSAPPTRSTSSTLEETPSASVTSPPTRTETQTRSKAGTPTASIPPTTTAPITPSASMSKSAKSPTTSTSQPLSASIDVSSTDSMALTSTITVADTTTVSEPLTLSLSSSAPESSTPSALLSSSASETINEIWVEPKNGTLAFASATFAGEALNITGLNITSANEAAEDAGLTQLYLRVRGDAVDRLALSRSQCAVHVAVMGARTAQDNATLHALANGGALLVVDSPAWEDQRIMRVHLPRVAGFTLQENGYLGLHIGGGCLQKRRVVEALNLTVLATPTDPVADLGATKDAATGLAVAAGVLGGGGAGAGAQVSRSSLALNMVDCEVEEDEPLDASESPTQIKIGLSAEAYYVGGALMNHIFLVGIVGIQLVVGLVYSRVRGTTLLAGLTFARCPSLMSFPVLLLLESTTMCAMVALVHGEGAGLKTLGVASLILCFLLPPATFIYLRVTRFVEVAEYIPVWDDSQGFMAWFWFGNGKWRDREIDPDAEGEADGRHVWRIAEGEGRESYVQMHRLLFQDYKRRWAYFIVAEMVMSVVCGAIDGFKLGKGKCTSALAVLIGVFVVFLVFVCYARPFHAPFLYVFTVTITVLQLLGAILVKVYQVNGDPKYHEAAEVTTMLAMYLLMLRAVYDMIPVGKKVYRMVTGIPKWIPKAHRRKVDGGKSADDWKAGTHMELSEALLRVAIEEEVEMDVADHAGAVEQMERRGSHDSLDSLLLGEAAGDEDAYDEDPNCGDEGDDFDDLYPEDYCNRYAAQDDGGAEEELREDEEAADAPSVRGLDELLAAAEAFESATGGGDSSALVTEFEALPDESLLWAVVQRQRVRVQTQCGATAEEEAASRSLLAQMETALTALAAVDDISGETVEFFGLGDVSAMADLADALKGVRGLEALVLRHKLLDAVGADDVIAGANVDGQSKKVRVRTNAALDAILDGIDESDYGNEFDGGQHNAADEQVSFPLKEVKSRCEHSISESTEMQGASASVAETNAASRSRAAVLVDMLDDALFDAQEEEEEEDGAPAEEDGEKSFGKGDAPVFYNASELHDASASVAKTNAASRSRAAVLVDMLDDELFDAQEEDGTPAEYEAESLGKGDVPAPENASDCVPTVGPGEAIREASGGSPSMPAPVDIDVSSASSDSDTLMPRSVSPQLLPLPVPTHATIVVDASEL